MVTYGQLESERWYRDEVVTEQMEWLISALCKFFGVPRANGGCKGDNRHLNGGHRGQNWILHSQFCTSRTYSVELNLPSANANDLAAFDITLPAQHMYTISKNADKATRAGLLEELVEWFGNINGDTIVDGWDNIRNKLASSDSSHLWHFHGRILRSLLRSWAVVRKIFAALTGQALVVVEDDMPFNAKVKLSNGQEAIVTSTGAHCLWVTAETYDFAIGKFGQPVAAPVRAVGVLVGNAPSGWAGLVTPSAAVVGEVDTAAILQGVDALLVKLAAEQRDAVADLGEGGAVQVRADQ